MESLLRRVGLGGTVPDFSTLSRRQKTLDMRPPDRGSTRPLDLLLDSTGLQSEGEGAWNARKHGGPKRHIWRRIHIGIDAETPKVRSARITGRHIGDVPLLPELLEHIP